VSSHKPAFQKLDNTSDSNINFNKHDSAQFKILKKQLGVTKKNFDKSRNQKYLHTTPLKTHNKNNSALELETEHGRKENKVTKIEVIKREASLDPEDVPLSNIKNLKRKLSLPPRKGQVPPSKKLSPEKEETDIEEYNCDICEEAFEDFKTLTKHFMDVHNSLMVFRCKKCFNRFEDSKSLKKHCIVVHKLL
jgi:hypothetical protein